MPALKQLQVEQGATFEDAPVPLHYGDVGAEYEAARAAVALVDRSDEGRLELGDRDRLTILNRMSTNAVAELGPGEGRATVLTTPIGRIIDRVILHNLEEDRSLLRTSAGRGAAIADYLRRNIFFRDRMSVREVSEELAHLALYGPQAGALAGHFAPGAEALALHHVLAVDFEDSALLVVALDPLDVPGYGLLAPVEKAASLWQALLEAGQPLGVRPAGVAACELLRIEAGVPGPEGELNEAYIPLEAGLWTDVSFNKGCYTGQEVIARLESRGKLAKTLVAVTLDSEVPVGMPWFADGRRQGTLTSAARLPDGGWVGLGFVRPEVAEAGRSLTFEQGGRAVIRRVPGIGRAL